MAVPFSPRRSDIAAGTWSGISTPGLRVGTQTKTIDRVVYTVPGKENLPWRKPRGGKFRIWPRDEPRRRDTASPLNLIRRVSRATADGGA